MDRVTKVKKYLKREQWKSLIKECQASGMTIASWCKQNDICEQTYYRNLKILREEICDSLPVPAQKSEQPVMFKKLEVQSPLPSTQAAVIIHLPSASLEIQNGANQQTVEAVLLALRHLC